MIESIERKIIAWYAIDDDSDMMIIDCRKIETLNIDPDVDDILPGKLLV